MSDNQLEFIPLHCADKLRIINPRGTLGIVTLWSKTDWVIEKLEALGVDFNPSTSKVAVVGNLYGNGIPQLLRNLLYNPQIGGLLICGADASGSAADLMAFFDRGIETTTILGEEATVIAGTQRVIDAGVTPEMFTWPIALYNTSSGSVTSGLEPTKNFINSCGAWPAADLRRVEVPMPPTVVEKFPSCAQNHNIVKDHSILEAWKELVFKTYRFGQRVMLKKGERLELQNTRVVINDPVFDSTASLEAYGFEPDDLRAYQDYLMTDHLSTDRSYTYGNRLKSHFGVDGLRMIGEKLKADPQDRRCYLTLWDGRSDYKADSAPCMVSLYFRVFQGRLSLTATYRTHNVMDAWLVNAYGLKYLQGEVAAIAGLDFPPLGPLTIISHSISIDTARLDLARRVAEQHKYEMVYDENGLFEIGVDGDEIVARHVGQHGALLHEYRAKCALAIRQQMSRDCAISEISHALYVGSELEKAQAMLDSKNEPQKIVIAGPYPDGPRKVVPYDNKD